MIEMYIFFHSTKEIKFNNPQEKLHGYIFSIFSKFKETKKLHNVFFKPFSISPIYEIGYSKNIATFKPKKELFFRFATTEESLFNLLNRYIAINPYLIFGKYKFQITEVIVEKNNKILENPEFTLNFVSPVTFRISENLNSPVPDPHHILKFLKILGESSIEYPKITYMEGKTQMIKYSTFKLIGFKGKMKIFTKDYKKYVKLHYLGIGYSRVKGMGTTIIDNIKISNPKIKKIWKSWDVYEV
ncbi:CRISPR system precrRNA processing endoribonuclease RAMP protein Cas6 [Marinitoga sp. 1155]|uniref:CRISPR system precrRNA processing endoribonuclease RAMP protein Cas6 n=1 Tax=Marinitoga sp. 1155 TaxID=1428448 RepID=UPI000640DCE1|nr:CRISPR system precrRNA processing endoribonuclease RAMP protein Cas6 [Marinitoga sp. 1155]KLO24760.1 hypothetical protein X274_01990 [Marinitoga sp. 1155]